ncbi:MAG: hypothetical protein KGL39_02275 [Patescibacteria group bacterium]|nr:hypothetical protein [Patescibacteria group bacterium]
MALSEDKIKSIAGELDEKITDLKWALDVGEKRSDSFLTVKLGLTSFIGVIFTIAFASQQNFPQKFMVTLSIITLLTFLLLMYEFWKSFFDVNRALDKQGRRVTLAQFRHIAAIEKEPELEEKFTEYARAAETLLNEEHKITQSIKAGIALETIVADQKLTNKWWILNLLLWSLLFLSVPILVILNIFHSI